MPKLQFWYEFGSTYSYLSAMRIEALANTKGVDLVWRPFLLGPIFRAAGWKSSPFLEQPDKLAYMWHDVERAATARGHLFRKPSIFPANGVYAARIALVAEDEGWIAPWTERVFKAVFVDNVDISSPEILAKLASDIGQNADDAQAAAQNPEIKDRLRQQTEHAQDLKIFGAPAFITEKGELFWGDDRLEMALDTVLGEQPKG